MVEVAPAPAKEAKKRRVSKPRAGPGLSELVVTIVSTSNERGGVSWSAIKRALTAGGYDVERNRGRVKLVLRSLVLKGTLIQVKGSGASGSFKISKKAAEPKARKGTDKTGKTVKKPATHTKKPAAKKSPKKAAAKKTTRSPKKTTRSPAKVKTPKKGSKKTSAAKKSPKKLAAKKTTKSPAKAAKSPKKMTKSPKKGSKKTYAAKKSPVKRVSKPKTKKPAPKKK